MSVELISGSHSVGEANYHMGFTPAYRRPVFQNKEVWFFTRDYMVAAAKRHGITIRAVDSGPDHCHVFTAACKNHSPSQVAGILKGFSSFMMRKNHRELFAEALYGDKFWSGGYFYRTVGAVNVATVERYVKESQSKHWTKASGQRKLIEFKR
jgi:putative transposase